MYTHENKLEYIKQTQSQRQAARLLQKEANSQATEGSCGTRAATQRKTGAEKKRRVGNSSTMERRRKKWMATARFGTSKCRCGYMLKSKYKPSDGPIACSGGGFAFILLEEKKSSGIVLHHPSQPLHREIQSMHLAHQTRNTRALAAF